MFSMDFKGKAKWDSWESRKGLSKQEAEQKYIEIVQGLVSSYPTS